jgi:hypothetical protein
MVTHVPTFSLGKTSEIAPPDTDRKALPPKPVKKRNIRWTAMLLANATGKLRTVLLAYARNSPQRVSMVIKAVWTLEQALTEKREEGDVHDSGPTDELGDGPKED